MTKLTRVVRRKVETTRGAELVVALSREGIWIREPRKRLAYLLGYDTAWRKAAELYGLAERRRKAAERRARREAK